LAKISITMNDWILKKVSETSKGNKSQRIEELIMRGLMDEQREYLQIKNKNEVLK